MSCHGLNTYLCTQNLGSILASIYKTNSNHYILVMESQLELKVKKLTEYGKMPYRATSGSAGLDIFAAYPCSILPQDKMLIKTDIAIEIPEMSYARIAAKSSLAFKHSILVMGGVIDSGICIKNTNQIH